MHPNDERQLQTLYRDWAAAVNRGADPSVIAAIETAIRELKQAIPMMQLSKAA